jgi:hypothetical protein
MKNLFTLLFTLGFFHLIAQTGPGGVGSSSNNVVWLDGNTVTIGTNPYIATWPDQSGNGNNFSQATASKQPTIVTYYGFHGVRFDGGDMVRSGAISGLNTIAHSQFIVYNGSTTNHTGILFEGSFTESSQFFRTFRTSGGTINTWVLNNLGGTVANNTSNSSAFQLVSSLWDGTAETFNSFKDGTSIGSDIGANGNPTGNYANTVGSALNNSSRFNGDMGEVIIYNTTLNSAQRIIVDNYLSSKFNISISNDKYAYDAGLTHRYQLIGIGKEADGDNLTAQGKGIVELSVGSLNNGDYVFTGHNNTSLATTTNDVPVAIAGGSRLSRTWRVDVTGTPGNIDVTFNVSSLTLPTGSYYLLVESANGVFNDGGVVEYGPFADVAGLVTFSGISFADGDYFSLASGSNAGITSVKTGYWDVASTWSCNCIPISTDNITIAAGHTVTGRTSITTKNLTITGNLNTLQTPTFNISGNLTVNAAGAFTSKVVTFNGTSAQTMSNASSTVDFSTLRINNSNGVNIQSGNFSVSNSLTVSNGPLQNNGGTFTLISNATNTAVLINGAGGLVGEFIVQRYISQRNASWGDLSSPVSNSTLRDWDSNPSGTAHELYMCGVNGFSGSCGGWESVYLWEELFQDYVAITDTTYPLVAGQAVELWLEDTNSLLYNTTFDTRGTPNYGDVVVPVSNSWNLVGNPYAAWITWSNLTKPTLNSTYYIWNTSTATYDAKTSGSIPPHQGFWVESTGSGNLTFTESSKSGSGSSTFYKTKEQVDDEPYVFLEAKLKITNPSLNYSHELKLRLNDLAKVELDEFDASFLPSRIAEAPSITAYNKNVSKHLAISSFNNAQEVILPITIKSGVDGKHILNAIDFKSLEDKFQFMTLVDSKTNQTFNLKEISEIELKLTSNEEDNRFELRLINSKLSVNTNSSTINIYKTQQNTVIEFANPDDVYTISIVNVLGQKVISDITNFIGNQLIIPNTQLPKGINIISVKSNNQSFIKKLNY